MRTAGKPCPPRAAAPGASPPGMGAGLQTVDKLLAFKLESDSLLLACGAGNRAQEQVRRDPTLTRRRRMKLAGSTPPSRQPGCFPSDAFSFSLPLLFFHGGKRNSRCVAPSAMGEPAHGGIAPPSPWLAARAWGTTGPWRVTSLRRASARPRLPPVRPVKGEIADR